MSYITALSPNESFIETRITGVEMQNKETNFLIQLLKQEKPKKILELGVAAGGTTAYLLHHMEPSAQCYSVDISQQSYRNKQKRTGYIADETCTKEELSRRILLLGKDIICRLDEIGEGIDFCLLDTAHRLPGEVLHFLAVLPYLKDGALVVLHDIHLNLIAPTLDKNSFAACATTVLFSTVSSPAKYCEPGLPNIGAFRIGPETREHVEDLFHVLLSSWAYYPGGDLPQYTPYFEKHYSEACNMLFQEATDKQKKLVNFWNKLDLTPPGLPNPRAQVKSASAQDNVVQYLRPSPQLTTKIAWNIFRCRLLSSIGTKASKHHYSKKLTQLLKNSVYFSA